MSKPIFRYSVSYGLQGCYMPDSISGPYTGTTRRELANLVRGELSQYGMAERRIRDVRLRDLWRFIKRNGSSSAHFHIADGEHNVLSFHGLTEDEAKRDGT